MCECRGGLASGLKAQRVTDDADQDLDRVAAISNTDGVGKADRE
jgi:hypothetical protein